MQSAEHFEKKLSGSRVVAERVGALKALFFRDANSRTRALRQARLDPSRRVQAAGTRLDDLLQLWLRDAQSAAYLGDAVQEVTNEAEAGAEIVALGAGGRHPAPVAIPEYDGEE